MTALVDNFTGGRIEHSLHVVADDFKGNVGGCQWLGAVLVIVVQLISWDDGLKVIVGALGSRAGWAGSGRGWLGWRRSGAWHIGLLRGWWCCGKECNACRRHNVMRRGVS